MTLRRLSAVLLAAALSAAAVAQQPATQPLSDPKAEPKKATPEEEKAVEYLRAGKTDDALAELKKAAKANPQSPPPRVRLAEMLVQAGQFLPARAQVELAATEDPRHPGVVLYNAALAYRDGRLLDTVLGCQAALALAADPRWDAEQKKRFTREARMGLAAAFETRRDWAAVKENATAALNDDPKYAPARMKLADATFWLGGPEQAFADLQAAYKDDPTVEIPELRMAQLWAAKDDAKTEDWFKKAVAAHPKDAKAHRAYAGWLLDNGRPDSTQLYVDSATKLDPNSLETIKLRGLAARYRKDYATAEQVFEGLSREYPNDIFAAWNLALVLAESPDATKKRRAVDLAESEVRKNPRLPEAHAVLGWCYYRTGRLDDAERSLANAISGNKVPLDTAYFLARVQAERGKTEEAYRLVKEALAARGPFPFRPDAKALLDELEKKLPKK